MGPTTNCARCGGARDGGAHVTRFGSDALGRRVWKASAQLAVAALLTLGVRGPVDAEAQAPSGQPPAEAWARTAFVWPGAVLLAESDRPRADALATVYVYEPGSFRPLALAKRAAAGAARATYQYHLDHLGTPQELTDAAGRVAWSAS